MSPHAEDRLTRAARALYAPLVPVLLCARCRRELALADSLAGKCSACGARVFGGAGPSMTPERGAVVLEDLKRRRAELGLEPDK